MPLFLLDTVCLVVFAKHLFTDRYSNKVWICRIVDLFCEKYLGEKCFFFLIINAKQTLKTMKNTFSQPLDNANLKINILTS